MPRSGPKRLLADPGFRLLFTADAFSQAASRILVLALPLVAISGLGSSAAQVGFLTACLTVSPLVIGLPAGAWVDRMRRRPIMVLADIVRAAALLSVPTAWWLGALTMWQLYAVALVTGVSTVFFDVGYQSYLPHLVGRDHLVEANSQLQAIASVSAVGGPSLGGLLIQAVTAPYAVAVNALGFLASGCFLAGIRKPEPRPATTAGSSLWPEVMGGIRFVIGHPLLWRIAASAAIFNLATSASDIALLVLLAGDLDLPPGTIGLFFALAGLGGLTGAVLAGRVARRLDPRPAMIAGLSLAAPCAFALPFAQSDWRLWVVGTVQAVLAAGAVIFNVNQVSLRQMLCPDEMLGRMNATMRMAVWGTVPLGSVLGGFLGTYVGVRPAIVIAAGILTISLGPLLIGGTPRVTVQAPPRNEPQD
ncbi:MAG TPA: MFS transporter [Candidatus Limnocylindrales bacterium]|nr:MFS transporter [Candidatus Limnocylindrales bacterium]